MVFKVNGGTPRIVQPSSNSKLGPKHVQNEVSKLRELKEVRQCRAAFLADKERKHRKHEKADAWETLATNLSGVWKERVTDPLDDAIDSVLKMGGCFLPTLESESAASKGADVSTNPRRGVRRHRFSDGHKAHQTGQTLREQSVAKGAARVAEEALRETLELERHMYQKEREEHTRLTRIRKRTNGIRVPFEGDVVGEAEEHSQANMMTSLGSHGG
mmetsp:Transcript_4687/g.10741  ORF Transcript_4687/g.10741 Transcript_4687/m.10741 type:complete len:216 (-) Transcript_4687:269-916(-)